MDPLSGKDFPEGSSVVNRFHTTKIALNVIVREKLVEGEHGERERQKRVRDERVLNKNVFMCCFILWLP